MFAFKPDFCKGHCAARHSAWVTGVVLGVLTASFGVTGYSLPQDQIGYWTVKIVTGVPEAIPVIGSPLAQTGEFILEAEELLKLRETLTKIRSFSYSKISPLALCFHIENYLQMKRCQRGLKFYGSDL
ncbi:cytochrome b6 [Olea europaea subsp. europaea]|uniref:Cytochrome b6 (Chloroplast) n=1 Tax=Olea europaea subsp. europaea TaxID=158383 RepID=A0A8S0RL41_OLEEU|nr:cytochrome b6 [Olea europaea subsp. europaea]